jgi:precorrin-6Y C5,15-methyltransferase (decarboxylating)
MMEYIVVGISNSSDITLPPEVAGLLPSLRVFSGGKRHYALVKKYLPADHQWIDIQGDMPALFKRYRTVGEKVLIFASGDPLFYGIAATIQKYHPGADMKIYPHFNSIQLLCQKAHIPYQDIVYTSVHGRSWEELDVALIRQPPVIGVLTDHIRTPAAIAQRMLDYAFDNYAMFVGEELEAANETVTFGQLQDMRTYEAAPLNCVLLVKVRMKSMSYGIPDSSFYGLDNRPNMITKMPVRMVSLAQLDLSTRITMWDIGFCTGAVSIEARRQYPSLQITAFEIRPECSELFERNTRKHSTPGITKVMGDFFDQDLSAYAAPEAVFIGGHGNRLEALIQRLDHYLPPKGRLVINAVKEDSKTQFLTATEKLQYTILDPIVITVDEHNPITILTAEKQ